MGLPTNILNKDNIHGLICGIKFTYQDENGADQHIRLCNWSTPIILTDPDTLADEVFNPYPFTTPDLNLEASKEIPTISIQLPITLELLGILKSNASQVLGNQVVLLYTNQELLDIAADKYVLFRFYLDTMSLTDHVVSFTLNIKYNTNKITIPRRKFKRNYCPWRYKDGVNCTYRPLELASLPVDERFWDANNIPIPDTNTAEEAENLDACAKTLHACRLRQAATLNASDYGASPHKRWYLLPFGGFPAAPTRDPRRIF